jgi:hypothetical protein
MYEVWLRLKVIYNDGQLAVKFITIPLYALLVVGILKYGDANNGSSSSMNFLEEIEPSIVWAVLFMFVPAMRIRALIFGKGSYFTRIFIPSWGLCVWFLLLVGNLTAPVLDPTSFLYAVPLAVELWLLSRAIDERVTSYAR